MIGNEVLVSIDGLPRPAVVVREDGDRVLVRFRDAGGHREEWVARGELMTVEESAQRTGQLRKLVGLTLLGLVGLALLLLPGGSDRPARELFTASTPSPSASAAPSASPSQAVSPAVVDAVLFGDSFTAGRGAPAGTVTALPAAAKALGWRFTVRAGDGTGYTTGGKRGGKPFAVRAASELTSAPDVLVLQGGASDTGATDSQLRTAATALVAGLQTRFPTTRLVLVGPVALEQPADAGLVRVAGVLRTVATARKVAYVDPIALRWITPANFSAYVSPSGFYPNAKGHAYLGARLATELARLLPKAP